MLSYFESSSLSKTIIPLHLGSSATWIFLLMKINAVHNKKKKKCGDTTLKFGGKFWILNVRCNDKSL